MTGRALSLVGRIAFASSLAAAVGGAGAAISAGVTARELGAQLETRQLLAATGELADELNEELFEEEADEDDDADEADRSFAGILRHELDDVKLEGARAALFLDGRRVAGATDLPRLAAEECREVRLSGGLVRACTKPLGSSFAVTLSMTTRAEQARSQALLSALLFGSLGGALLGGVLSYLLARWAVAPLDELRDGVRRVQAQDPKIDPIRKVAAQPEIEELRAAIVALIERLAGALSHAQAFAAEAAHELRTPLTMIAGELELMTEDGGQPSVEVLLRVRAQVDELTLLVQRLLVLAQSTPSDMSRGEVIDLSDVLGAVEHSLDETARERVRISCEDDVLVRGDGALLRSLLSNAVDNALKFSSGPVDVKVVRQGGEASIDIIDSGPGVSSTERELVFSPFYRSPSVRATGVKGHGLGLALIANVAAKHQGTVEFVDRGCGAHLRVRLPRLEVGTGSA